MKWIQVTDPWHNMILSTCMAIIPIAFIFWALIIKKMKGYLASVLAACIALAVAVAGYQMPWQLAVLSGIHGSLYALFPISWIIFSALFLFNISARSGKFEVIKHFLASVTSDRRLQILLIAFSFGAFLEGVAGFATPVVITAAMLCGLGFDPFYAAGICLIANTAPVAFGSMGIPIVVAANVSGVPEQAISQMVGRTLPFISLFLPFYMVSLTAGFKKSLEIWPACLVSGVSFSFFQWFCANHMGPSLPDVVAGLASIACLMALLKYWKPQKIWRFQQEPPMESAGATGYSRYALLIALAPFIMLTLLAVIWNVASVKTLLDSIGTVPLAIPGLDGKIVQENGNAVRQVFQLNLLSVSGTAIFLAAVTTLPIMHISPAEALSVFLSTARQLKYPMITIASVLAFAYILNFSGMSGTIARALTHTGFLFPFFAPVLGWLGVFITGSDTSANALFGKLQAQTASSIHIDPVVTVAANCSGGVVGKMISPQSVAIAAAAGGLTGKESRLFRFTLKHSLILLLVICILVFLQAYILHWLVPAYLPR